mmetsp:Transcript_9717/g.11665  ORF Transcript_9717/g.11665 Transcript_9717/m.11665 type:complete len:343 (+) Transcript_9717:149-1177(+)
MGLVENAGDNKPANRGAGGKRGNWSEEEDSILREAVTSMNCDIKNISWRKVAASVVGRSAKQCRERWRCSLDPSIKKTPWTDEEDATLLSLQLANPRRWALIAQHLPGRTENAIKTRFRSIERANKKKWTPQEDKILLQMRIDGCKYEDIAARLAKRTKNAVTVRYRQLMRESELEEDANFERERKRKLAARVSKEKKTKEEEESKSRKRSRQQDGIEQGKKADSNPGASIQNPKFVTATAVDLYQPQNMNPQLWQGVAIAQPFTSPEAVQQFVTFHERMNQGFLPLSSNAKPALKPEFASSMPAYTNPKTISAGIALNADDDYQAASVLINMCKSANAIWC